MDCLKIVVKQYLIGERKEVCSFPRLVSEPMKKNNHIICRMCTEKGKLEEFVATKNRDIPDAKYVPLSINKITPFNVLSLF